MTIRKHSFSEDELAEIRLSLENLLRPTCHDLFGPVLQEWFELGFAEYADRKPAKQDTNKRLAALRGAAEKMMGAFAAFDDADESQLPSNVIKNGFPEYPIRIQEARQRIEAFRYDLKRISEGALFLSQKFKKPSKKYVAPFMAVRDLAVIFKWATNRKPTFHIDPIEEEAIGPFFKFTSAVWPHLSFAVGKPSLIEATRKWSASTDDDKFSETIYYMALRHPKWGLFQK